MRCMGGGDVVVSAPQGVARRLALPWAIICRPYGAAVCRAARGRLDSSVTKFGLLRESSRSFTKVRTDQARKSSMLRIVTGEALF
jgi:hypothetical protein